MLQRLRRLFAPAAPPDPVQPAMPFLVGSPRSGTTLLRFAVDAHPEMAIPPETAFLVPVCGLAGQGDELRRRFAEFVTRYPPDAPNWSDFGLDEADFRSRLERLEPFSVAAGCRAFYRLYADRAGKPRYGDKTPYYCRHLETIQSLLPEARFVHIVRDGRDAAASLRRRWFSPGDDVETLARFWRDHVSEARRQGARCRHYLEIRYEDLLREPEPVLRRVCGFLDLEFAPAMLQYYERVEDRLREHGARTRRDGSVVISREERVDQVRLTMKPPDPSRIGAWRQVFTPDEARRFDAVAGDLLDVLGYRDDRTV